MTKNAQSCGINDFEDILASSHAVDKKDSTVFQLADTRILCGNGLPIDVSFERSQNPTQRDECTVLKRGSIIDDK